MCTIRLANDLIWWPTEGYKQFLKSDLALLYVDGGLAVVSLSSAVTEEQLEVV